MENHSMPITEQQLELKVVNSPSIMMTVIEIIKRRKIRIKSFLAEECPDEPDDAQIKVTVHADEEMIRRLISRFEKQADVITIKTDKFSSAD
jgi:acetolactate synthase small subunit